MMKRETTRKEPEIINYNIEKYGKISESWLIDNYDYLKYYLKNRSDFLAYVNAELKKLFINEELSRENLYESNYDYVLGKFQNMLIENGSNLTVPGVFINKDCQRKKNRILIFDIININEEEFTWIEFNKKWNGKVLSKNAREMISDLSKVLRVYDNGKRFYIIKLDKNHLEFLKHPPDIYFLAKECYLKDKKMEAPKSERVTIENLLNTVYKELGFVVNKIIFEPNLLVSGNCLNLWMGFIAKRLQRYEYSIVAPVINYIEMSVLTREWYHWILSLLSWIVKYPHIKTGKCLILLGTAGLRINLLLKFIIKNVIGDYHSICVKHIDELNCKSNVPKEAKILCCVEDLNSKNHAAQYISNTIESIVNADSLLVKRKYIDPITINNGINLIVTTDEIPFNIKNNHIYVVPELSNKIHDHEYFATLVKSFNQDIGDHFYTYLLQYDGIDVRDSNLLPCSKELVSNILLGSEVTFIKEMIDKNTNVKWEDYKFKEEKRTPQDDKSGIIIHKSDFFRFYKCWCIKHGKKAQTDVGSFWKNILPYIEDWEQIPEKGRTKIRLPPNFKEKIPYFGNK